MGKFTFTLKKCISLLLLVGVLVVQLSPLGVSPLFAANPPTPFSPQDNILDPNCLPSDTNCYIQTSNQTFVNATATNLVVTSATSSSFFSSFLTALTAFFTTLTATNAIITNSTTTNQVVTNFSNTQ